MRREWGIRIGEEGVGYQECLVKNTQFFSRFILNSKFQRSLKRFFPLHWGVVALRLRMCHFRQ